MACSLPVQGAVFASDTGLGANIGAGGAGARSNRAPTLSKATISALEALSIYVQTPVSDAELGQILESLRARIISRDSL